MDFSVLFGINSLSIIISCSSHFYKICTKCILFMTVFLLFSSEPALLVAATAMWVLCGYGALFPNLMSSLDLVKGHICILTCLPGIFHWYIRGISSAAHPELTSVPFLTSPGSLYKSLQLQYPFLVEDSKITNCSTHCPSELWARFPTGGQTAPLPSGLLSLQTRYCN